jgi:hypothetical protein
MTSAQIAADMPAATIGGRGEAPVEARAPSETSFAAFVPRRVGVYFERFHGLALRLGRTDEARVVVEAIQAEDEWTERQPGAPEVRDRYRAALAVLADLIGQGWVWRYRGYQLELAPPDFTTTPKNANEIAAQKDAIRLSMASERLAELSKDSTRRFLAEMEQQREHKGSTHSILSLIASGEALARDLRAVAQLEETEREEALDRVIQPYLQFVSEDQQCKITGYRLIDVWRYFRYYWSLPYFSTPGRNLFYLVRDAARPLHPVIGIAALGNSMVRLGPREEWIGWTVESVAERVAALNDSASEAAPREKETLARSLFTAIEQALTQVNPRGLVNARELANPTEKALLRLLDRARSSALDRVNKLRAHQQELDRGGSSKRTRPLDPTQTMFASTKERRELTLADQSVDDLYMQKRATEFHELLRAKQQFLNASLASSPGAALDAMLRSEDGQRAIAVAVKATKKEHIGTSMMDVIICGAIPPYTHVLGGKLVCMLLTSPQVRRDYVERYADLPSEIASRMKGEWVRKRAELVFLGTTSLYHVGSSQYNRVRVPAAVGGGVGEIRYEKLGATEGFGSVHYAKKTRDLLERIATREKGAALNTRTFGEGVNPKLRLVREGLGCVGLDQNRFLRHHCRRIVYGVALAGNTREYLRGEVQEPEYFLPMKGPRVDVDCTRRIASAWKTRWLNRRIDNNDVLERVASSAPTSMRMSAVGSHEGEEPPASKGPAKTDPKGGGGSRPPPSAGPIGVAFIQQLYNHRSCYADRLTPEQLDAIHVRTPLEDFILGAMKAGKDVILTGNPGDGKTHLIMRLLPQLMKLGVEHHTDATAEESHEAIVDLWRKARRKKRPFCLAINEWPLFELCRDFGDAFSPVKEVREQIQHSIVYEDAPPADASVIVIDLNHRNVADADVFNKLLETITGERFFPECPSCPARQTCDVPKARRGLADERVRVRLFKLLDLVTKRGHHVTMRDLQGFVAYLVTGGRSCEALMAEQDGRPHYSLAFEGESDVFDAIRDTFDPARVTHPAYDEALWTGTLPTAGWAGGHAPPAPPSAAPGDQLAAMRVMKRRFFFEHADGERLLDLLPKDERAFYDTLNAKDQGEPAVRRLVRLINRFFDPREQDDSMLRVWAWHRYDARWSPTYLSIRSIPIDRLRVEIPRLSPLTARAYAYQPDHAVLGAHDGDRRVARLVVDLALFRTLHDAQRGLPMALRSAEVLKRLDIFFSDLGRAFRGGRDIEDVHVKNFETGEDLRFKIDRRRKRYSV